MAAKSTTGQCPAHLLNPHLFGNSPACLSRFYQGTCMTLKVPPHTHTHKRILRCLANSVKLSLPCHSHPTLWSLHFFKEKVGMSLNIQAKAFGYL